MEYDDISPVHYINISEEYAKEIEAEAMSRTGTVVSSECDDGINMNIRIDGAGFDLGMLGMKRVKGACIYRVTRYTTAQLGESMDVTTL